MKDLAHSLNRILLLIDSRWNPLKKHPWPTVRPRCLPLLRVTSDQIMCADMADYTDFIRDR